MVAAARLLAPEWLSHSAGRSLKVPLQGHTLSQTFLRTAELWGHLTFSDSRPPPRGWAVGHGCLARAPGGGQSLPFIQETLLTLHLSNGHVCKCKRHRELPLQGISGCPSAVQGPRAANVSSLHPQHPTWRQKGRGGREQCWGRGGGADHGTQLPTQGQGDGRTQPPRPHVGACPLPRP